MTDYYPTTVSELISDITAANGNPGSTIHLVAGGTYTLTTVNNTTSGPNGLPVITSNTTIEGNGATIERMDNAQGFRLFHVTGAATIKNATLKNGGAPLPSVACDLGQYTYCYTFDYRANRYNIAPEMWTPGVGLHDRYREQSPCAFGLNCQVWRDFTADHKPGNSLPVLNWRKVRLEYTYVPPSPATPSDRAPYLRVRAAGIADIKIFTIAPAAGNHVFEWEGSVSGVNMQISGEASHLQSLDATKPVPYIPDGSLTVHWMTVWWNGASWPFGDLLNVIGGGAIRTSGSGVTTLIGCHLLNNTATGIGGAVENADNDSTTYIENCRFSDNEARLYGGAIANTSGTLEISESTFINNRAGTFGGTIANVGGTLNASESIFIRNLAIAGPGAAIYNTGYAAVYDSVISENVDYSLPATTAGAICSFNAQSTLTINRSAITGNTPSGVFNEPAPVTEADATYNWWGSANGPAGAGGTGSGDGVSDNVDFQNYYITGPTNQVGSPSCGLTNIQISHAGNDQVTTGNPISLRFGEKRLEVTDLSVNSPAGPMTFLRTYQQDEQETYQFMGLGWNHNHAIRLIETTGPDKITVELPTGKVFFDRVDTTNLFQAEPGSVSFVEKDDVTGEYTLTAGDKSLFHFDSTGKLLSRTWTNSEVWTYSYYTTGVANGKLQEVNDGYGRKLQFSYIDNVGQYDNLQLWRVGDQTATDLDTSTPSGRYVEFDYASAKLNGAPVSPLKALLTSVQDVRGESWTYDYYGQDVGETDSAKANFMIERLSPPVDVDGGGVPSAAIVLEQLTYDFSPFAITQQRGNALLETHLEFEVGGDTTTEETAGITRTHQFFNGVYAGVENPAGDFGYQVQNQQFRPFVQIDAKGNPTALRWSNDGKHLEHVLDALGNPTDFSYNTNDTLQQSVDANRRKTEYIYGDMSQPRLPTQIKVIDIDQTLLRLQEFTYDSKGRILTEQLLDPADGTTVLQETTRAYYTSGPGNGLLETLTQVDPLGGDDPVTTYTYDSAGRVIKTQKSSLFGSCQTSFTVYDAAGNIVASICNYAPGASPDPTTAAEAAALYNPADPDHNHVTTYRYDEIGRRVEVTTNAGASFAQTTITLYDALDRVWRTITNYRNAASAYTAPGTWVWNETSAIWEDANTVPIDHGDGKNENIISDTSYNARGFVKSQQNVQGQTTLFGYDDADRLVKTIQNATDPDYDNDYVTGDPDLSAYVPDIIVADADIITAQAYDEVGNVIKTIDPLGAVTFTAYDALNRPVQVVSQASDPNYDLFTERDFSEYAFSDAPDEDLQQTTTYDAMGRVLESATLVDQLGAQMTWLVTRNVYDALGRQTRTIRNYTDQGEDPSLWVWDAIDKRWERSNGTAIVHGTNADENLISEQVYDPAGRIDFTRDTVGRRTKFVYDGLGRQTRVIANYIEQPTPPADWTWSDTNNRWEYSTGNAVNHGTDNDLNIITETIYDSNGFVSATRSPDGGVNFTAVDDLGRTRKSISNYVVQGATNPLNWVWRAVSGEYAWRLGASDDTPVDHGDSDANIILETEYDAQGRAFLTRDSRGLVTRQVFDESNRNVKTISNFNADLADSTPENWVWREVGSVVGWRLSATDDTLVGHGTENDQNLISAVEEFDRAGRVISTRDVAGLVTLRIYDSIGRQRRTIMNYVAQGTTLPEDWTWSATNNRWESSPGAAVDHGTENDLNLISDTEYDKAGRALSTRDVRGTAIQNVYDGAGRQRSVVQAAGTGLATTSYTSFDKVGRILRRIENWIETLVSPDARNGQGEFEFAPDSHGIGNDQNLITSFVYDGVGRQIEVTSPAGSKTQTVYGLDGQVRSTTEVGVAVGSGTEDVSTQFRYDGVGRRRVVVQAYVAQDTTDPSTWVWDATDGRWETATGTAISHGTEQDRNLIVQVKYDLAGRMTSMRTPAGVENAYRYDALGRRIIRVLSYTAQGGSDPADWVWSAANERWERSTSDMTAVSHGTGGDENMIIRIRYVDLNSEADITGQTRTVTTQPDGTDIVRDFDRLGRAQTIGYDDLATTPDVEFAHDIRSNRVRMTETGSTGTVRETLFQHDLARRLIEVGFDTDGDSNVDETVGYGYNLVGQRTLLVMPGSNNVTYSYDARGQMRTLTAWNNEVTQFNYDAVGRHTLTERANGLRSLYRYDAEGRLRLLKHAAGQRTFAQFAYQVDARGNRTQAFEAQRHPGSGTTVIDESTDSILYTGAWSTVGGFRVTSDTAAVLRLTFAGNENVELTVGEGPDHGRFDVYIGGSLWETIDGYAASAAERVIPIPLSNDGPFDLALINRADRGPASSGNTLRFKQLSVDAEYTLQTIQYTYDAASRVLDAEYYPGRNTASTPAQTFAYSYDVAGNLTDNNGIVRTFNKLNQISSSGFVYDANGNLTDDNTNAYSWSRANRLLSMGGHDYAYDGMGNRVSQTVSSTVTQYLLDLQPGLVQVLRATESGGITPDPIQRYIHGPRGIHAEIGGSDVAWTYMLQDGLSSVRSEISPSLAVDASGIYQPYGIPTNVDGTFGQPFHFTGEMRDENALQYHRARHYAPGWGSWLSLDVYEGILESPVSLNGYNWVEGNIANRSDPSGFSTFDIWVAAFISPLILRFPYGVDPIAIWEGDDRDWFTRQNSIEYPPSSRVWWSIRLDTEDLSNIRTMRGTGKSWNDVGVGATRVVYAGINGIYESWGVANAPDRATISCREYGFNDLNQITVKIKAQAQNPLSPIAPPIEIDYTLAITGSSPKRKRDRHVSDGSVSVEAAIDRYPWHELFVIQTDSDRITPQMVIQKAPGVLMENPGILVLPAYWFSERQTSLRPIFVDCGGFPTTLDDIMDALGLGC